MNYLYKYFKYKDKYLELKQHGGLWTPTINKYSLTDNFVLNDVQMKDAWEDIYYIDRTIKWLKPLLDNTIFDRRVEKMIFASGAKISEDGRKEYDHYIVYSNNEVLYVIVAKHSENTLNIRENSLRSLKSHPILTNNIRLIVPYGNIDRYLGFLLGLGARHRSKPIAVGSTLREFFTKKNSSSTFLIDKSINETYSEVGITPPESIDPTKTKIPLGEYFDQIKIIRNSISDALKGTLARQTLTWDPVYWHFPIAITH
ncbi:MAG: hypothetical protein Harvfovirus31_1, partial [Harvfovirus sp.]